ncbi:MAG TPA: hypothetical protein VE954_20415 [Oligoflexus sp.]|uniref:hypothetical protein n=1 Tax=Oligoflexus sp. TaxID=1971216 RepID=UPI002D5736EC|nr:hypothetical protein [Oligoflexus sp.]HYX35466.1 hypothetical protein [Oligoflexus sp.]
MNARLSSMIAAGIFMLSTSHAALQANTLPKPSQDTLQAMQAQVGNLFARCSEMLELTGDGNLENDAKARVLILEFSKSLEKLQDALDQADANYHDDSQYGPAIKNSCLATRKLFLSNSRARSAAGEHSVGGLRPDNPAFDDNRFDVQDIRNTVFCDDIEKTVNAHAPHDLKNTHWNSGYWVNGKKVDVSLQLNGGVGGYQASGLQGRFFDVVYFPGHVSGRWEANGNKGWFEFPLSGDQRSFSGFWGRDHLGSPIGGEWSGRKK